MAIAIARRHYPCSNTRRASIVKVKSPQSSPVLSQMQKQNLLTSDSKGGSSQKVA